MKIKSINLVSQMRLDQTCNEWLNSYPCVSNSCNTQLMKGFDALVDANRKNAVNLMLQDYSLHINLPEIEQFFDNLSEHEKVVLSNGTELEVRLISIPIVMYSTGNPVCLDETELRYIASSFRCHGMLNDCDYIYLTPQLSTICDTLSCHIERKRHVRSLTKQLTNEEQSESPYLTASHCDCANKQDLRVRFLTGIIISPSFESLTDKWSELLNESHDQYLGWCQDINKILQEHKDIQVSYASILPESYISGIYFGIEEFNAMSLSIFLQKCCNMSGHDPQDCILSVEVDQREQLPAFVLIYKKQDGTYIEAASFHFPASNSRILNQMTSDFLKMVDLNVEHCNIGDLELTQNTMAFSEARKKMN